MSPAASCWKGLKLQIWKGLKLQICCAIADNMAVMAREGMIRKSRRRTRARKIGQVMLGVLVIAGDL